MDAAPEKPELSEPEGPRRHGSGFGFLWALLAVLVVYPLSIGPAARLHQSHPAARSAIEAAYKPVTILTDHSPGLQNCVLWYLEKVWRLNPAATSAPAPATNSATVVVRIPAANSAPTQPTNSVR